MLIIGTGGLARDVITSWEIDLSNDKNELFLFDNKNLNTHFLYEKYPIFHSYEQVERLFNSNPDFFVCIGNPLVRKRITETFESLGGNLVSFISCCVSVVSPETKKIAPGVVIEPATVVSKDVILEKGVFVNAGTIIGHDAIINQYVSIGPGVRILGGAEIGEFSYIGTNAVIMPGVKIGKKVRIGVGKIIEYDVPDNTKII